MTALFITLTGHQQGAIFLGVLGLALFIGFFCWALCRASAEPAPRRLPGALGDSVRGEDDYYERLRTPGMGSLDPDAPTYSTLADEQPAVVETLDAARLRRSGS